MSSLEETSTPVISGKSKKLSPNPEPLVIAQRYKVLKRLGEGGMGKVYESIDTMLDRKVAVKILAHFYDDDEQLQRFQQEAKLASKLNHPGIVTSYDFGVSGQRDAYYVMECVEGRDLSSHLSENGPLSPEIFFDLFIQIVDAMDHAHSLDVVHRDLKPSNIMVHQEGDRLKGFVLDFGVAKGLEESLEQSKTKTGQMIGSPRCISPEQILTKPTDCRCDIYSLGCVMYEALTGKPPYIADTALETMEMHLKKPAPQIPDYLLEKDSIRRANCIIQKALSKDPQSRYQSMDELAIELKSINLSLDEEISSIQVQSVEPVVGNSKTNQKYIVFGLVALSTLIGLVCTNIYFSSDLIDQEVKTSKRTKTDSNNPMGLNYEVLDFVVDKPLRNSKKQIEEFRNSDDSKLIEFRNLDFQYSDAQDEDLRRISKCINLEILNLSNTKITSKGLAAVLNLPKLEILHLSRTHDVKYYKVKNWSGLKSIRSLSMEWNKLDDTDLISFVNVQSLQKIRLNNNPGITNFGLKILAGSNSLKELDLSGTKITPAGLKVFKGTGMIIKANQIKDFENVDESILSNKLGIKLNLDSSVLPGMFTGYRE